MIVLKANISEKLKTGCNGFCCVYLKKKEKKKNLCFKSEVKIANQIHPICQFNSQNKSSLSVHTAITDTEPLADSLRALLVKNTLVVNVSLQKTK